MLSQSFYMVYIGAAAASETLMFYNQFSLKMVNHILTSYFYSKPKIKTKLCMESIMACLNVKML